MPTYDLICESCGTRFERFLPRLLRREDKVCPECGSDEVRTGVGGGVLGVRTTPAKSSACSSSRFS